MINLSFHQLLLQIRFPKLKIVISMIAVLFLFVQACASITSKPAWTDRNEVYFGYDHLAADGGRQFLKLKKTKRGDFSAVHSYTHGGHWDPAGEIITELGTVSCSGSGSRIYTCRTVKAEAGPGEVIISINEDSFWKSHGRKDLYECTIVRSGKNPFKKTFSGAELIEW